jgi:hypothetical protein
MLVRLVTPVTPETPVPQETPVTPVITEPQVMAGLEAVQV